MDTTPQPAASQANRQIARAAGIIMLAMVITKLVGLVYNILSAQTFGTSAELDSFLSANRVEEMLFNLIAGGALASAFIPTFTAFLTNDDRENAWKLASAVVNWISIILITISLLAALLAPQIVHYILYGLAGDIAPEQEQLTIALLRIQLPAVAIFGISGLIMGVLNAHQVFLAPALAPSMYSFGLILGIVFLVPHLGIMGLAWGVLLGASLHLVIQIPSLSRLQGRYWPILGFDLPAVGQVVRLMGPRLFGVAVVQINFLVNTIIANGISAGSNTAITQAFALMLMPQSVIAQAIATAAMPTFSAQYARGRLDEMRDSLSQTLRSILLLSIPAAAGLLLLRRPLVAALYQHGETFTAASTDLVAWALLWYSAGLVSHCLVEVLSRAFYAMHNTKTPVTIGVVIMTLNIALSFLFVEIFNRLGWAPHGGLALANTLATTLEAVVLLIAIRRRLGHLNGRLIWSGFGQAALPAVAMALALFFWLEWSPFASNIFTALGGILIGVAIYLIGMLLLKVPELRTLTHAIQRRLS